MGGTGRLVSFPLTPGDGSTVDFGNVQTRTKTTVLRSLWVFPQESSLVSSTMNFQQDFLKDPRHPRAVSFQTTCFSTFPLFKDKVNSSGRKPLIIYSFLPCPPSFPSLRKSLLPRRPGEKGTRGLRTGTSHQIPQCVPRKDKRRVSTCVSRVEVANREQPAINGGRETNIVSLLSEVSVPFHSHVTRSCFTHSVRSNS